MMLALRVEFLEIKNALIKHVFAYGPENNNLIGFQNETNEYVVPQRRGQTGYRRNKCRDCDVKNLRCYHCFSCGAMDHRMVACPKRVGMKKN